MNEWVGMGIHRDIEFPGAGVKVITSYQKPNSGHPEEQWVLLTTESSLQAITTFLWPCLLDMRKTMQPNDVICDETAIEHQEKSEFSWAYNSQELSSGKCQSVI